MASQDSSRTSIHDCGEPDIHPAIVQPGLISGKFDTCFAESRRKRYSHLHRLSHCWQWAADAILDVYENSVPEN